MGAYRNAMEILVEEEVEKQIKALPARSTVYINRLELVAYALNQLPSLYATSEKGFDYQVQRGRAKFAEQIAQAVRRALAAIRRDPIRTYAPLQSPNQPAPLREVLHELRLLLKNDKVDWETLPKEVERALATSQPQGMTWDARYEAKTQGYPNRRLPSHRRPSYTSSQPNPSYTPDYLSVDQTSIDSPMTKLQGPPPPPPYPSSSRPTPESATKRNSSSRYESNDELPKPEYGWDDPFYTM